VSGGSEHEEFCYLTTTGRKTGRSHTIEIWFALSGPVLYMLSGGGARSDWVRNIERDPEVTVRIGGRELAGRARLVTDGDEERRARELLFERYRSGYGGDLTGWRDSALPVAVDLQARRA
jgi:deazaflavin-dependent oxidoreductase (nitroreductase family)